MTHYDKCECCEPTPEQAAEKAAADARECAGFRFANTANFWGTPKGKELHRKLDEAERVQSDDFTEGYMTCLRQVANICAVKAMPASGRVLMSKVRAHAHLMLEDDSQVDEVILQAYFPG